MHYLDEGPASAPPVLLLHGMPAWSYLYRKMIPPLVARGHRVVAPDLIGFGRSDKLARPEDYTYETHVEWLLRCVRLLDLRNCTLVLHDWGGLVGLRLVADEAARIDRLVIMDTSLNTGDERIRGQGSERYWRAFAAWREFTLRTPEIRFGPMIHHETAKGISPEVAAAYDAPYPDDRYKAGPRINDWLYPLDPHEHAASENRRVKEALRLWTKPTLMLFSESAERLHPGQRAMFRTLLPPSSVWRDLAVPDTKHFLQEDSGAEVAALVDQFIAAS